MMILLHASIELLVLLIMERALKITMEPSPTSSCKSWDV